MIVRVQVIVALVLASWAALGCQAAPPDPGAPRPVVGEPERPRRVVGWRLVERTYGKADAEKGVAGDGIIPGESRVLVYLPVLEDLPVREYGALRVRTACEHEIRLRILGSREMAVGETATAECRIDGPPGLYHEVSIEPSMSGMEVLGVRGAARAAGHATRYFVAGNAAFQVDFTSKVAGRGTVSIAVVREVGRSLLVRTPPGVSLGAGER